MANYDVIKTYGIEITAVTDKATDQINQLEKELDELSKKKGLSAGLQSQIDKIGESLNGLKGEIVSSTKSINDNLSKINTDKMSQEFKDMQNSIASSVNELQEEMKNLKNSMDFLKTGDFSGFTSGIGKSFDTLSDNISDIVGKFSELSNFVNDIRVGAIDTSGLQKSEKGVKTATSHITNDLAKTKTKVEELLRQMRDAMDDFTLDDLMSDGKNSGLGTEEARTLSENIDIILQSIDELKKAQVDVNDIFNKDGIKLSEKALKGYRTELNKIVKERTAEAAKERKKSTDPTEVRFRYVIEDPNSSTIDSIVDKVKTDVIEKVQKRLDGSPIRIPIGYTYDKAIVGKNLKDLDDATGSDTEKVLFKHLNLDVKADTSKLFTEVNTKVFNLNEELKKSGRKIEVEVVGKVDESTVEESSKRLAYEIEDAQYQNAGLKIKGGNLSIDPSSGIATETTLSDIKTILSQWNTTGIPGTQSKEFKEQLKTKEANAVAASDFDALFRTKKQSSTLIKKLQDQNDTTDSLIAKLLLRDEAKNELNKLIRSSVLKKGGEEGRKVLQNSKYFTNSFTANGIEYAKYGDGKTTLADWQDRLNKLFDSSFDPNAKESLFDTTRTFAKLNEKGEQVTNEAGEIVSEEIKIKGALKTFREKINKQNKATRESLVLNGVEFAKDEKGKYTNRILYEKGTVTSNEDAYAKSKNLANLIKEDAREEYQIQKEKKKELSEQRDIMQQIFALEQKQKLSPLSKEDNELLLGLREELNSRVKQIANHDKYDELTNRKQELTEKRLNEGLSTKEFIELQSLDNEIENLFVDVQDLSDYVIKQVAINVDTGLSSIDQRILDIDNNIRNIVNQAQRNIGEIYNPTNEKNGRDFTTAPVTNQARYDWNQNKISELEQRNAHLERLVKQNRDKFGKTSFDYSSMTSAEKAEYFSNQKAIRALKTRNLLYAEQNNIEAELLDTKKKINAEEKTTISTLHVSSSDKAGYEKLFGQRMKSSVNSDEEFIHNLSDEELIAALSSLDKVTTAIDKRAELSNEEIRALVQNRINEDIKFLRESLEKEEKELIDMEKKGASKKSIDNKQYRINRLSSSIGQLENPEIQSDSKEKLEEEREILAKINQEQEELIDNLKEKTNVRDFEIEDVKELWQLEKRLNEESSKLKNLNIDAWQHYTVDPSKMESKLHQADSIGWDQKLNSWELEEVTNELNEQIQKYLSVKHELKEYKSELESLRPNSLKLAENVSVSPELLDEFADIERRKKESEDRIFKLLVRQNGMSEKQFRDSVLGGGSFDPFDTSNEPDSLYNQRVSLYTNQLRTQDNASVDTARTWLDLAKQEVSVREEAKQKAIETHAAEKKIVEERNNELNSSRRKQQENIVSEYNPKIAESQEKINSSSQEVVRLQNETIALKEKLEKTSKQSEHEFINLANQEKDIYTKRADRLAKIASQEDNLKNRKSMKISVDRIAGESDESYNSRLSEAEVKHKKNIHNIEENIRNLKKENATSTKNETKELKNIVKLREKLAKKYKLENLDGLSSNGLYNNSEIAYIDLEDAQNKYNSSKSVYGESDENVINLGKELVKIRNRYIEETAKYISNTSVDELDKKILEKFNKQSKLKLNEQTLSLNSELANKENELKNAQVKENAARSELAILEKQREEAEKRLAINEEIKKFQKGMSSDQKKASLGVDYELMKIQDMEEELKTLPKTSKQYQELSRKIKVAKDELFLFRQEAESLGLTLSETTGRMFLGSENEKNGIEGLSYTGLFKDRDTSKVELPDYKKQISDAKKLNAEQVKSHHYHSTIVDEIKAESNEQARLNKMWNIAGMSDREAEVAVEISKVNAQLKNKKDLTEAQTEELKEQLAVLHKTIETEKLDIKLGKGGYVDRKVSRSAFIANPEQFATNKYLQQMLSSPTATYDANRIENYRGATESTLQNIQNILKAGIKVKVVDKLDSHGKLNNNVNIDADKPGYIPYTKNADKTAGYGKNEKGKFNIKGYQEVAKELGLLQKSKDGNFFVSKKDRNKVYSEMDKRGIARYLEEDTNATKKNIEAKKESKKVVDKDTDATKQNSQAKKSNAERERGKDFGDGAKYINSDISVSRKQLARKNLGDDTRNKWQSIFDSATAEAEKRGYQKNAQGFYEDQKKKQEVAKKTTKVVEQESKKQEMAKDASAEAIKGVLTQAEQLLAFYKSKDTLNEKELADVSQLEEFIRVNKAGLAEIETETKESSSTTVQSEEKKQEAIKETRKEIDYEKASVEELINAYKKSEKALKTSRKQETIDYHNGVIANSGKALQDKGYSLTDGKWGQIEVLTDTVSEIDLKTASLKELYAEYERLGDAIAEAALAEDKFAEQRLNEAMGRHGQVVDQLSNRYGFNIGHGDTALAPGVSSIADTKAYVLSFKEESDKVAKELREDGKQAGQEFGKSVEEGANDALGINSPSTVFQEIAHWCGEGFKVGLDKEGKVVYGAVSEWRDKLLEAFKSGKITMKDLISFKDTNKFDGRSSITKAVNDIISNNLLPEKNLTKAVQNILDKGIENLSKSELKSKINTANRNIAGNKSTANDWKQILPEMQKALDAIIAKEKEAQNEAIKYLDKQSDKYKTVIGLAEELGLVLGNNVNITEKVNDGIPSYSLKGELASANINLREDGSWHVSSVKEINDGYSKLKKTLSEISNLKGYKIDLLDESDPAMFGTYADKVKEAKDALVALRLVEENGYNGEPIEDLVQKLELVKRVSSELKGSLQVGESEGIGKIDTSRLNQVRQQLEALAFSTSKGSVEIKKMSKNNTELTYTVRTADNMLQTYTITMNKYTGALTKTLVSEEKYLSGFQKALKGIGAKFQEIFRYTIASVSIYEVFNFFKQGINVVKEMDAAMTELRKVSNDTEAALQSFRKESYEIANTIASTGKEIVNSAADWERLGYSIQEASELARNSALYANVGDMEIDVATEHMVSTLKAFNIEAKDSIRIVDKFNEIGNSYAITSSGIGEALERSASSLVAAGNDIDKSIALITAGNIVSQDPESVGNAIKVLSLRVRGSKTELEEMGEETDNLASSTSKLRSEILDLTGVDLMLDDNTYKDTYTILLEISKVWDQLSDVSQANVLEKLAGKTRASVVAGLLQQGETLEQVYKDSQNAAGSAEEENQKYMESIQGHLDVLTNKWQQMWDSGINADFINFFIDLGAGVLDVVNKIGLLKSSFLALGTVFTGKEIFKAFKGEGRVKMFTLRKYAFEEFNGDVCELRIA